MRRLHVFYGLLLFGCCCIQAMDLVEEMNLRGKWRFEIGDSPAFAQPAYDDAKWQEISVPGAWEKEGFPGYDGYAWYRIQVYLSKTLDPEHLYLQLGRIDDVDQVYLNGRMIGETGRFPPDYKTAYNVVRLYKLDKQDLHLGEVNTIAVRVYDGHLGGGIVDGDVGIFRRRDVIDLEIDLSGNWKFSTGDNHEWLSTEYDDYHWNEIKVPFLWEKQGYELYDGYAVYRKRVVIPENLSRLQLVLLLGCISDIDETFFNGQRIGKTGVFPLGEHHGECKDSQERAYPIPSQLIKFNQENIIVVRVFDNGAAGGIYKGYVGIAASDNYVNYNKLKIQD